MRFSVSVRQVLSLFAVVLAVLALAGCASPESSAPVTAAAPAGVPKNYDVLHAGDLLTISFSDIIDPLPAHEERIKDDGTITLPLIGPVKAEGKSPGTVQREIHDLYVPKYYRRLAVTLKTEDRFFYVGGEVKMPGRLIYSSEVTVLKAIKAAGDFTDFANKHRIEVNRADGRTEKVDGVRAQEKPTLDLPIYPGDQIVVKRRYF